MSQPTVSVIIPTWDRKRLLNEAIESVLRQCDSPPFEIVVVNDGSVDGTDAFLARLTAPIKAVTISHTGNLARVRNKGLEIARGKYVLFLDDDDLLESGALRQLVQALDHRKHCGFAFGDIRYIEEDGTTGPPFLERRYDDDRDVLWNLIAGVPLFSPATIVHRSLLINLGALNTNRKSAEDYDLWLRVALNADGVRLPQVVTRIRRHSNSLSTRTAVAGCVNAAASLRDLLTQEELIPEYRGEARRTLWRLYRQVSALYLQEKNRVEAVKFANLALQVRPVSPRGWLTLLRAHFSAKDAACV